VFVHRRLVPISGILALSKGRHSTNIRAILLLSQHQCLGSSSQAFSLSMENNGSILGNGLFRNIIMAWFHYQAFCVSMEIRNGSIYIRNNRLASTYKKYLMVPISGDNYALRWEKALGYRSGNECCLEIIRSCRGFQYQALLREVWEGLFYYKACCLFKIPMPGASIRNFMLSDGK